MNSSSVNKGEGQQSMTDDELAMAGSNPSVPLALAGGCRRRVAAKI
jgi:hypothetical protein